MKNVSIVGLGALGSHLVLLARNWDARFNLIDFDRVEAKNLQSQFHSGLGKGKNKATALGAAMQGMWQRRTYAYPVKLDGGNALQLLGESDLIIDCTDNLAARKVIQDFVKTYPKIACLHGCLSADGTLARVVWTEHFQPDPEGEEGQATCEDGENLGFHAMAGAVLQFSAALFLKTGVKQSFQLTPTSIIRLT